MGKCSMMVSIPMDIRLDMALRTVMAVTEDTDTAVEDTGWL